MISANPEMEIDLLELRRRRSGNSLPSFTEVDTFEGQASDPTFLHKYNYGNGDPIQNRDPTGNFAIEGLLATMSMGAALDAMLLPRAAGGYRAAQAFQQNSGLAFGQPFVAVQTDVFGDAFGRHLANDQPGFWESIIPVWGSFRNAYYNFAQGNTGWGLFYSAMTIVDVGFMQSLAKSVISLARGGSGFVTLAIRKAADGSVEHAGWETAGKWYDAARAARGAPLILREMTAARVATNFGTEALAAEGKSVQLLRIPVASLEQAIPTIGNTVSTNCVVAALQATHAGQYYLPGWLAGEALMRGLSWFNS